MSRHRPRFYVSFRSPYSWLAYRELVDRHPDLLARLEWRPFWEPDEHFRQLLAQAGGEFPYVDMSRAKSLYILQDVQRLARSRGLRLVWPVDRGPVWEVAHLAYLVARRHGQGRAFAARVYQARWEQGRDISDRATIAAIAADLGLDPQTVADAVDDPAVCQEGVQALLDVCADGVFGVPFFVHGREKFWGVDRLPAFVESVAATTSAVADSDLALGSVRVDVAAGQPGPAADLGHAGGCG